MKRLLLFLLGIGICCHSLFASDYDNVLVITIDTLRSDYLSCYGSSIVQTPNIDSLARTGVVFKNTVSATPFTLPSHTSLFTGLTPPFHGVHDNGGFYLDQKILTLAEVFKLRGYHTAAFVGAFPLDSRFGLDQGFDFYDDSYPVTSNVSEVMMPERGGKSVTDSALKWLSAQTQGQWFVWMHYYDPHFPYNPPQPYKEKYAKNLYAGEIASADEQVGRVLQFLKERRLTEKTLVVLTSDHGESLGEHSEKTHGIFAYESTLRVPLIFSPAKAKIIDRRVRLIDVAPTILDLQTLAFPGKIQGTSLVPSIKGKEDQAEQDSYFESLSMYYNAKWAPLRGLYSKNFKYIELPVSELYDLSQDPHETKNLCAVQPSVNASPSTPSLCEAWSRKFADYSKAFRAVTNTPAPVDPETAEQLRALGYVSTNTGTAPRKNFGPADDPKTLISIHNRIDAALGFNNRGYQLKALEILEKVMEERPDYSIAYLHAAYIRSSEGFPEKAVEILKSALQNGIEGNEVHAKLGLYLYEAGNYEESINELNKALRTDSKDLDTLNYLGMAYTAKGNFLEAEKTFQKALLLDDSDAMTLNNLGTLYLQQKKLEEAIAKFKAAVALNPNVSGAYNGLAVIYASRQNWDEAIANWNLAIQSNHRNYDAMLNLAYAYLQRNEKEKALPLFQDFTKNAPPARYANDLAKVRSIIQRLQ